MATGMQLLIVICVALIPFVATLVTYIINWANGSSFLINAEMTGLQIWDVTAAVIWLLSQILVPPSSFYTVKSLGRTLDNFASGFNAKLKNLVSAGKHYFYRDMIQNLEKEFS